MREAEALPSYPSSAPTIQGGTNEPGLGSSFRPEKKYRIAALWNDGKQMADIADRLNTSISYVRQVLSDADLLEPRFRNALMLPPPNADADMIARRAHVERQKALFRKAAGL